MTKKHTTAITSAVTFMLVLIFAGQPAQADWGVSFYGEVTSPGYEYYGDRITQEYRRGYQVDDWVERGASSVTDSPVFADGVRLTAWSTQDGDDYDFALASGIYFFEIPDRARSIRVKIYYDGEADRGDFNGGITGRVWVRRSRIGDDYTEFYPDEGRYEDADEPLYGDTFVLRASKHLEILRMSAEDHVIDGMMELHIVAEGRQRIDVKYIEVETYSYLPSVRVVTRYHRDYSWKPWYNYTYWYFYTGPEYHFADHYYVRYTYPRYRYHYVDIRKQYNDYLRGYYVRHPHHHVRWANVARVRSGEHRTWSQDRLNRWTRDYDEARRGYVVTSGGDRRSDDVQKSRVRVRDVLSSRSRVSPAMDRARSGITAAPSEQGRTVIETRGSSVTDMKRRREDTDQQQDRTASSVRTRTQAPQEPRETPTRVETPSRTRISSSSERPSVRTRSSSSSQQQPEREIQRSPSRSVRESQPQRQPQPQTDQKRQVIKTRTETRKDETPVKQTPSVQEKDKDDDDDDDKDKKKSDTGNSSDTTTKKRVRTR